MNARVSGRVARSAQAGLEVLAVTSAEAQPAWRLGVWERTLVDNRGTNAFLTGSTEEGRLVLTGTAPSRHGSALDVRVTSTRKSNDRFEQRWERTTGRRRDLASAARGYLPAEVGQLRETHTERQSAGAPAMNAGR